ncbi:MAG TPA: hypothetical protein VEZ70_07635 [Allosphingosinicella sp.]|nr:hypothetical protein [Allosphingosinicella sp.]
MTLLPLLFAALAPAAPQVLADDFERGLCLGGCRGWNWPASQQIDGTLAVVGTPGHRRLLARTGPRGERVPKAALIARPAKVALGGTIRVAFTLKVPHGAPLNSIHLVDIECASCGEEGNPGIRLYLRDARLRIDRSKIGERHAWADGGAPQLRHGASHRIELAVRTGFGAAAGAEVRLDGRLVLRGDGDTVVRPVGGAAAGADRIQIGLTASSNSVPAAAFFDDIRVAIAR